MRFRIYHFLFVTAFSGAAASACDFSSITIIGKTQGRLPALVTSRLSISPSTGARPLAGPADSYDFHPEARLDVRLKATGEGIGDIWFLRRGFNEGHAPLFFLDAYHGQGLGREAKEAVLAYGFEEEGLRRFVAYIHEENHVSQALHRRLGFRLAKDTRRGNAMPTWVLSPEDFAASRSR